MEFGVLGPLMVRCDGRDVPLGGPKQRAVLAMLLLRANEAVARDRLIDALWGARPPPTAAHTLDNYVSRLRKVVGNDRLQRRSPGYVLRVESGELDLDRFELALTRGRETLARHEPSDAANSLREALALWRGPALADLQYEPFAHEAVERLEERRLQALEERLEADLGLGCSAELVPELEALVREHPFRERLVGQLMVALYRAGRQTEALEAYRAVRRTLVEEVGIEPGAQLRALERAVLAQDPALDAPPTASTVATQASGLSATAFDGLAPHAARRPSRALAVAVAFALMLTGAVALIARGRGEDGGASPLTADSHAVAVIDPASNEITNALSVGANPGPLAFEPRSGTVWVGNIDDSTVTRIEPRRMKTGRTVPVGERPTDLEAEDGAVWVAGAPRSKPFVTAQRIDARFDSVRPPIRVESLPQGESSLALRGNALWVAPSFGLLTRVDPATGRDEGAPIGAGHAPTTVAADARAIWVADSPSGVVTRIDPRSGALRDIPVPGGPADIALGGGTAWVSLSRDDSLARIETATGAVRHTISVGRRPAGVAVGAGAVWVANSGDGTVSRIDPTTTRVTETIDVGASPQDVIVADGRVWVSVRPRPAARIAAEGGTVRVEMGVDVDSLDPALAYVPPSWQILHSVCATLVNYPDQAGPAGTRLEPELAVAIPRPTDGGRTYTFRIRSGFRFSPPSGEAVTPQTVKASIERTLHPQMRSPAAQMLADVVGARAYAAGRARHISGIAVTPDTLTLRLIRPASDFLSRISLPFFCVVPGGTPVDGDGLRQVPTAGPYYVSSHLPGEQIVLSRNPSYQGSRQGRPSKIRIAVNAREDSALARAEASTVDYVPFITERAIARRLASRYGRGSAAARAGRQRYFTHALLALDYLAFNTSRPPFASARLRRAVNYALDRRLLARGGLINPLPAAPTDQYLPPGTRGFNDVRVYPMTPDLERARRLAGNERRTVVLYAESGPAQRRFAEIVKANLRAIGIDVQIKKLGNSANRRAQRSGEPFDMVISQWFADFPDPVNFLSLLDGRTIAPNENVNVAYFNQPAYNRKLSAAAALPSPARELALGRLDAQVASTAAPWAAVANETGHDFFSDRVGCQVFHPVYGVNLAGLCVRSH